MRRAEHDLALAVRLAQVPVKQTVLSPSAFSLLYPAADLDGYPREAFLQDLLDAHEAEVRAAFEQGARWVQIDFSDARLALALDPGGRLLEGLVHLNSLALARFSDDERARIGVERFEARVVRLHRGERADEGGGARQRADRLGGNDHGRGSAREVSGSGQDSGCDHGPGGQRAGS